MATKYAETRNQWYISQKERLVNSSIPGRKAKDYWTCSYVCSVGPMMETNLTNASNGNAVPVIGLQDPCVFFGERSPAPKGQSAFSGPSYASQFLSGNKAPDQMEVNTALVNKMIQKLQQQTNSDFNLAVFVAEFPAAVSMFVSQSQRIARSYHFARKGRWKQAFTTLSEGRPSTRTPTKWARSKDVANLWLEWKYGVAPLLADIDNACKVLANKLHKEPKYRVTSRFEWARALHSVTPRKGYDERTGKQQSQLTLQYTISNALIAHAASLGLTNPMAIAWEVTPLSYVFDWVIPIGSWLAGMNAYHGLSFYDGCFSHKGEYNRLTTYYGTFGTYTATRSSYVGGELVYYRVYDGYLQRSASSVRETYSSFHRTRLSAFPQVPPPQFKPLSDIGRKIEKVLTSLSLIRQKL